MSSGVVVISGLSRAAGSAPKMTIHVAGKPVLAPGSGSKFLVLCISFQGCLSILTSWQLSSMCYKKENKEEVARTLWPNLERLTLPPLPFSNH